MGLNTVLSMKMDTEADIDSAALITPEDLVYL